MFRSYGQRPRHALFVFEQASLCATQAGSLTNLVCVKGCKTLALSFACARKVWQAACCTNGSLAGGFLRCRQHASK